MDTPCTPQIGTFFWQPATSSTHAVVHSIEAGNLSSRDAVLLKFTECRALGSAVVECSSTKLKVQASNPGWGGSPTMWPEDEAVI